MDYFEWAEEYYLNARRVHSVIERKSQQLKEKKLSADQRKHLTDDIKQYRRIYHELREIGDTLKARAEGSAVET